MAVEAPTREKQMADPAIDLARYLIGKQNVALADLPPNLAGLPTLAGAFNKGYVELGRRDGCYHGFSINPKKREHDIAAKLEVSETSWSWTNRNKLGKPLADLLREDDALKTEEEKKIRLHIRVTNAGVEATDR